MIDHYYVSLVESYNNFDADSFEKIKEINRALSMEYLLFEHIVVLSCSQKTYNDLIETLENDNKIQNLKILLIGAIGDTKEALFCGVRNSIGDYILILDNDVECFKVFKEINFIELDETTVYYFKNTNIPHKSIGHRIFSLFNRLLEKIIFDKSLIDRSTNTILISRRIANRICQKRTGKLLFKSIRYQTNNEALAISYHGEYRSGYKENTFKKYIRVLSEVFSTTSAPLKIVSSLMLIAASMNAIVFLYALVSKFIASDIEPGWVSSTMQNSIMFFLISVCLYCLVEYLTNFLEFLSDNLDISIQAEYNQKRHIDQLNVEKINEKL